MAENNSIIRRAQDTVRFTELPSINSHFTNQCRVKAIDIELAYDILLADYLPLYLPITPKAEQLLWAYLNQSYGIIVEADSPDMTVFVNAQSNTFNREVNTITGDIQLAPIVIRKRKDKWDIRIGVPDGVGTMNIAGTRVLCDCGAFPEVRINCRITPEGSLDRQLDQLSQFPVKPKEVLIVSYDRLIDEKYVDGDRKKERWGVEEAEFALQQTIDAAQYLDSQRHRTQGLTLVQSCQGVDAPQYLRCVEQVLKFCQPQDVLGLGGWCILGKQKSWLPTFWETIRLIIPAIASRGIKRVHIFGVTWWRATKRSPHPPLGSLLWLCDQYGIELTTDGRSPIGNALWKAKGNSPQKAGALHPYWRWNLALTRTVLGCLRSRPEYQPPPNLSRPIQLSLF